MPKLKVGDINIYYEVHGEGEPLVMIMGASGNIDWMKSAIPIFSHEYKLVLFDNRDAGQTDVSNIPYTLEVLADDLAGLLDALKIESAHIQGASMGGMIAQQFVLRYPNKVRSLILACTYCGGPNSSIMTDPDVKSYMERAPGLSGKEMMMETLRLCLSQKFIENNPSQIKQMMKQMMKHPITPQGSMRQGEAVMSHNTYERLSEIKAPTLVISGDADKLIPVENSRIIASRIQRAELVILKDMGHMFNLEAGEEANRIILDFLRRHRTKNTGQETISTP
jgi:pimeloyl-ACP methyl ester carboxylesterase